MTRRDHVTKWICYALALVPLCILDQYVLGRLALAVAAPLLYPLAAVAVGMMEGPFAGSLYALACGVVWRFGDGPVWGILALTALGLASGLAASSGLSLNYLNYALTCLVNLLVWDAVRVAVYLVRGLATPGALLSVAVPELLVSALCTVPVYLLYRAVFRRVGGTRLA